METATDRVARIEHWLTLSRDMMIDLAERDTRQDALCPLLRPGRKKRRKTLRKIRRLTDKMTEKCRDMQALEDGNPPIGVLALLVTADVEMPVRITTSMLALATISHVACSRIRHEGMLADLIGCRCVRDCLAIKAALEPQSGIFAPHVRYLYDITRLEPRLTACAWQRLTGCSV